ncbi:MAG: hydrogenase maturation nickel metallochaperone HypA [Elusimicrobiota bacterium]|jgi:hydrogenase nickel incorporation protein HypA/HybF
MHEYSLMERVLEAVLKDLKARGIHEAGRVKELSMRVGALELHSEESFIQAFQALTKGTLLEGAELKLEVFPADYDCKSCGHKGPCKDEGVDHHDPTPAAECPKCGKVALLSGGRGVEDLSLLVEESCSCHKKH